MMPYLLMKLKTAHQVKKITYHCQNHPALGHLRLHSNVVVFGSGIVLFDLFSPVWFCRAEFCNSVLLVVFFPSHRGHYALSELWENPGWRSSSTDLHFQRSSQCFACCSSHTHLLSHTGRKTLTRKFQRLLIDCLFHIYLSLVFWKNKTLGSLYRPL